MFFIQFGIVLLCILVGARIGGIGLGVMGGLGLAILSFGFGLKPAGLPIDVMFMIMAVVSAAAAMQASGGLDYMIKIAARILRKNPKYITFMAPVSLGPSPYWQVPGTWLILCYRLSRKLVAIMAYAQNAHCLWQ